MLAGSHACFNPVSHERLNIGGSFLTRTAERVWYLVGVSQSASPRVRLIWWIWGAYASAVLLLGLVPMGPLPIPGTFVPQDKLVHAVVFAGMAGLSLFAFAHVRKRAVLAFTLTTAVGGLLELLQALVPYRSADWFDLLADGVGAGLGALLVSAVVRLRSRVTDPRSLDDR